MNHPSRTVTRRQLLRALATGAYGLVGLRPAGLWARHPEDDPMLPTPTLQQVAWQEAELTLFLHFGINTFTDREWGEGNEDPRLFNPGQLDCRQWAAVAAEAGFRYMILTAKHHDGFCLWPSRYTEHSVKSSPWREGRGDVVRELSQACEEAGLKMGVYLSPWDRNQPAYGDSPVYNQYFRNQLAELLTQYGPIAEVWFDGACGEGPNGKRQEYDWASYYEVVRRHQPDAVIAICGPDIRWVGNEDGFARETEWSIQEANPTFHGREGKVWWPAECDVSIRPGWFWHAAQDMQVKSLEHLIDIYYRSVGRNSVLLLNVPPDNRGLIADPDINRLREWRKVLDETFDVNLAEGKAAAATGTATGSQAAHALDGRPDTHWAVAEGALPATLTIDLGQPVTFDVAMVQEEIRQSQRVEKYRLEAEEMGSWRLIAEGTTIGHKKLDRFPAVTARRVRLTLEQSLAPPRIRAFGLFRTP